MPAEYPMYQWACDLFPIHRSLTGEGVRETLRYLGKLLPGMKVHEVPSGTKAFDWTVPKEWVIREAYVKDKPGRRVIDIADTNLHVLQYSAPYTGWLTEQALDKHLHSLPDHPNAIPYVTSCYKQRWGLCIAHRQRQTLGDGPFFVHIDTELKDGHLTYGELIIPGKHWLANEVLLSTNICHPSLANNELSGPVLVTALAQWLASRPRRYTYRILFLPETIGALVYLSRPCQWPLKYSIQGQEHLNLHRMREATVAGYQVVCVGDERQYGYLPSRKGNTLADRAALSAFRDLGPRCDFALWSFLERGSDERQWCAPGVDLPVGSIMRSKYDTYPEYHTSLDNLDLISQAGLEGSLKVYQRAIEIIEANKTYQVTSIGEPFLGPLCPSHKPGEKLHPILNILAYADGARDLIDLADTIGCDVLETAKHCETLREHGHLKVIE